jgi:hypothetical protein
MTRNAQPMAYLSMLGIAASKRRSKTVDTTVDTA